MVKERVPETNEGIQDKLTVEVFDQFARIMRDKGWNNVETFISAGISGNMLEVGPGPGYVGLEILKALPESILTGCEISREMIKTARKNAEEYGCEKRTDYVEGNCMNMPFQDASFDAAFSNGSMHEWEEPVKVFNEIGRVLKPGGVFCISDMRRDVSAAVKWPIYLSTKPKEIKPGFLTSINAAYTTEEIKELLDQSALKGAQVKKVFFGLSISGKKAN